MSLRRAEREAGYRLFTDFSSLHTGYVVTKPHAERPAPYEILVQDGLMLDVDASYLIRRRIECTLTRFFAAC